MTRRRIIGVLVMCLVLGAIQVSIAAQPKSPTVFEGEIRDSDINVTKLDEGYKICLCNNLWSSKLNVFFDGVYQGVISPGPTWACFTVGYKVGHVVVSTAEGSFDEGRAWHKYLTQERPIQGNEPEATKQDIKFQGTAIKKEKGLVAFWWVIKVDDLISGPAPCKSTLTVITYGGIPTPGYVDPNIEEGNKVEVYGAYECVGEYGYVDLPKGYHYIKSIVSEGYNLRVQVYDAVTGKMISGAAVYIDSDPTPKGITDSNGEVTISIPKGHHTIRASNSGYEEGTWSGTIDHDMGIAIGLNPGVVRYRLRVQVYDATTRRMLPGASLFVDQEASPCSMTDANGEATISVSQDVHTIRASKPGYAEGAWNGQIDKDMAIAISLDPAEQRWNTVIRGRIVGEPNYTSSNFNVSIEEVIDDPAHGDNVIVGNTITVYTDSEQLYQLQNGDNIEISAAWDTHLYCLPSKYSSDYIKKISGPTSCAAVVVTGEVTSEPVHLPFRYFDLRIDEVIKNQNNVPSIARGQNSFVFFSSALDKTVGSLQAGDCVKLSSIWEEATNQYIPGLHCDPESCSDHYIQEIPCAPAVEVKFEGTITEPDNMAFDNRRDYTIKVDRIIENKSALTFLKVMSC